MEEFFITILKYDSDQQLLPLYYCLWFSNVKKQKRYRAVIGEYDPILIKFHLFVCGCVCTHI